MMMNLYWLEAFTPSTGSVAMVKGRMYKLVSGSEGTPVLLHFYQSADCFYKVLHRDLRNAQTVMGRGQARTVFVRAEQLYLALGGSVCLQTLKALLRIVEHQCRGSSTSG